MDRISKYIFFLQVSLLGVIPVKSQKITIVNGDFETSNVLNDTNQYGWKYFRKDTSDYPCFNPIIINQDISKKLLCVNEKVQSIDGKSCLKMVWTYAYGDPLHSWMNFKKNILFTKFPNILKKDSSYRFSFLIKNSKFSMTEMKFLTIVFSNYPINDIDSLRNYKAKLLYKNRKVLNNKSGWQKVEIAFTLSEDARYVYLYALPNKREDCLHNYYNKYFAFDSYYKGYFASFLDNFLIEREINKN